MNKPKKHAFVTGATRGIGYEIAKKLLADGFRVTGTAKSSPFPEELTSYTHFTGLHADLADEKALENELSPRLREDQVPDILINNAGIFMEADFSISDEKWMSVWDRTMQVNLRASSLLSKWFINAHMKMETKGILINVSSRAAYRGDTQEYAAYAASKAGMVAFTKSIARNFSKKGIAAYSIAPGFVETDMARDSISVYGEEYLTQGSAFDHITPPDQVANLVAYLARGEVPHMSGSTFHINGGSYMI
ncbi:MAG: SDR family NAD(P)-dependent oxidoreductase [Bacteroidetes bacterium]|jgi:NAD(P)-dependent dehydrogenase (short-subunit alcohol dehydrogenase family)|nr:SDR family NAD(P)-dependent oxidoreductase [Bacteroidota bacterium]